MKPIAALFWKEGRENLRWSLLGLALLSSAHLYALWQVSDATGYSTNSEGYRSLCSPLFLLTTTFGSAVAGLLLGLLQTLPERAADRWAFLVHRPLSAAGLLLGKAGAGLALYALAVVPPFLASAWWASVPGHLPGPFVPGMMVPGAVDLLSGVAWYFAGFLVGIRNARWWGTRLLPLAVGWLVTSHVQGCWVVGMAVGYSAYVALVLAIACWGVLATNDGLRKMPRPGQVGLFASFSLAGYAVLWLGGNLAVPALFPAVLDQAVRYTYRASQEGALYLEASSQHDRKHRYTDLAGRPVEALDRDLADWRARDEFFLDNRMPINGFHMQGPLPRYNSYRIVEHYVVRGSEVGDTSRLGRPAWFYVPGENRFRRYDARQRLPVGTLGGEALAQGEALPGLGDRPFPEPLIQFNLDTVESLLFPHAAYGFDEWTGKLTPLPDPEGEGKRPIYDVSAFRPFLEKADLRTGRKETRATYYAATFAEEVVVYDGEGKLLARIAHPHDPKVYDHFFFGKPVGTDSGYHLWYWIGDNKKKLPGYFDRYDAQGKLVSETPLPVVADKENPKYGWNENHDHLRPFLGTAYRWVNKFGHATLDPDPTRYEKKWWAGVRENPRKELSYNGWRTIGGAITAVLGLLWLAFVKYPGGWKPRAWWALGFFFLGPGSLFALAILAPKPRKGLAAPAPSGADIFEPISR